ncbi:sigma-70 family RNA polymerase sigma factor [Nannocystis sp. ILAH1]|uniref:sigma-70 family RNA polymerase sigma factor n=1 Tax=Nannocystis sp. ILAH1 TaxID=2996789 RepID=UPI00226D65AD|nr:sigma-70 family RNA polymerase sigma factor [Nannocystis sp. ILAH1]MCY0994622.1 sigma-70 family RNA polymerase sigma factor [Nannocystis sp. ILAH1]
MRSDPRPDDAKIRAFRELYLAEFTFVWATARRLGVPPTLVEDAVQDVFMTAYRRLDQVRFEVSARAWLHGVTRRIAARHRRTAARLSRRLAALAAVPTGPADPPQDRLAAAEQLERLLARLTGPTRAAFEMAELHGMSGPEIAGELGIPVATVYSRVRLAREQLQRELGGPGLERELAAARARETPPPAAAERTWAAMLPGLWTTRAGLGLAVLASTRTAVMTTLVAVAGVVAVAWPKGHIDDSPGDRQSTHASPRDTSAAPPQSHHRDPSPPDEPTSQAHESSVLQVSAGASPDDPDKPAADGDLATPTTHPREPSTEVAAADALAARTSHPDGDTDELATEVAADALTARPTQQRSPADELAAEVAVLDRARAELARGTLEAARAHLAEHARRFPAGQFADLRGATEIELLCREGDRAGAAALAAALVAAHPRSAVAQRFKKFSCPD